MTPAPRAQSAHVKRPCDEVCSRRTRSGSRPPARCPVGPAAARTNRCYGADGVLRGLDALCGIGEGQPGHPFRHGRDGGVVARRDVRHAQTSASSGLAGRGVVQNFSARAVGLLSAVAGDGSRRVVGRLHGLAALSRRTQKRRRPGIADLGAVLQFPCVQVQRQFRHDAVVGADHLVLSALLRTPQHRLCGARRHGGGRRHDGEILVRGAAGRARHRGADR